MVSDDSLCLFGGSRLRFTDDSDRSSSDQLRRPSLRVENHQRSLKEEKKKRSLWAQLSNQAETSSARPMDLPDS